MVAATYSKPAPPEISKHCTFGFWQIAPVKLSSGLSEGEQRDLLAAGQPRQLKRREVLGQPGEPADLFALVQVGHLKLAQLNAAGAETLVRFVGPGDC